MWFIRAIFGEEPQYTVRPFIKDRKMRGGTGLKEEELLC